MHILESQPEIGMGTGNAKSLFVVVKCAVKIQVAVDTATAEKKGVSAVASLKTL